MRTRWISPQFIATNRIDSAPGYDEVKAMGQKVIETLGIGTSATGVKPKSGHERVKLSSVGGNLPTTVR